MLCQFQSRALYCIWHDISVVSIRYFGNTINSVSFILVTQYFKWYFFCLNLGYFAHSNSQNACEICEYTLFQSGKWCEAWLHVPPQQVLPTPHTHISFWPVPKRLLRWCMIALLCVPRCMIESLDQEKQELDTCLGKLKTQQNICKNKMASDTLVELTRTEKEYQELIKMERENITELDMKVSKFIFDFIILVIVVE